MKREADERWEGGRGTRGCPGSARERRKGERCVRGRDARGGERPEAEKEGGEEGRGGDLRWT